MNIQERTNKDGKITSYRIRVFDHRDSEGKQVFKTLSVKYNPDKSAAWNRKNAEKQGAVFEKEVEEQTVSLSRVTFDEYSDYFVKIKEQAGIAASTISNYKIYKKKLSPHIGHIQLKSFSPAVLNKIYSNLISSGASKSYVHELHIFIHNVLGMALRENIITRNFAEAAASPKVERKEVTAIEESDLTNFFNLLYDKADYMKQVFFSALLASGCRIGELCALTWGNVDFNEGRIHICRHFIKGENGLEVSDGCKTAAGERWIYMDEDIMDMLREYRSFYLKTAKEYGSKWNFGADAVFYSTAPERLGYFITPGAMRNWLTKFLENNELPHIRPHQFRHHYASKCLLLGIPQKYIAELMGHRDTNMIEKVYQHTFPSAMQSYADQLRQNGKEFFNATRNATQ